MKFDMRILITISRQTDRLALDNPRKEIQNS